MQLGMAECCVAFSGHCDLDLVLRNIVSGAYLFDVGIPNVVCR